MSRAISVMGSETENLEEKLTSLLGQLQTENGIFERMVYKNKNQHRRCSYFQFLLKVRRDLKLLQSANLREILNSCFLVISGKKVRHKVHLLESLKKRKLEAGKFSFLERLLGVSRLLSQMVEPMVKAATEISVVLARTFFMGFSVTILALLARLRVLVQQILLDVVHVFNSVSSIARSKQTVKIDQGGFEVFREIFPIKSEFVVLECVWKSDKFVLLEKTNEAPIPSRNEDLEGQTSSKKSKAVRYLTVKSFLGELETPSEDEKCEEDETKIADSPLSDSNGKPMDGRDTLRDPMIIGVTAKPRQEVKSVMRSRKVAFVALKSHSPAVLLNSSVVRFKECDSKSVGSSNKEDSFFSLLAAGSTKESLF